MEFDLVFEKAIEPYQNGGFRIGQCVKLKKGWKKSPYYQNISDAYKKTLDSVSQSTFDLPLKIGAVKSTRNNTTGNYSGNATDAPDDFYVDVYIEYALGTFYMPMTLPCGMLDVIENEGDNLTPIPASLKRPSVVHGPRRAKAESNGHDVNLTDKNVVLPGANKWNDSKPGGGNFKNR